MTPVDQLAKYRQMINDDLISYVAYLLRTQATPELPKFTTKLLAKTPHWPGMLTMIGYEMCGGTNQPMILQAARAMEMCHIYVQLCEQEPLAAGLGNHAAQTILANLDVEPLLRSNTISITNRTLLLALQNREDLVTKAHYTSVNPIHVGMVLAGAGCSQTDAITPIAQSLGQAFHLPPAQAKPHIEQTLSALHQPNLPMSPKGIKLMSHLAETILST